MKRQAAYKTAFFSVSLEQRTWNEPPAQISYLLFYSQIKSCGGCPAFIIGHCFCKYPLHPHHTAVVAAARSPDNVHDDHQRLFTSQPTDTVTHLDTQAPARY
eukprot:scaffold35668_cov16-Prasinocladus_malaysianus.AAC.1